VTKGLIHDTYRHFSPHVVPITSRLFPLLGGHICGPMGGVFKRAVTVGVMGALKEERRREGQDGQAGRQAGVQREERAISGSGCSNVI